MTRAQQLGVESGLPEVPQPAVDESGEPGLLLRLIRDQRIAFLLVGGVNTAISLVLFFFLSQFVPIWGGDGALLAAQSIAIPCAFALHRKFVFRVHGHLMRDLGRFALVNVIPVSVNIAVLPVLTKGLGVPVFAAQVAFTMVWVLCSYFLHRGFSFKRSAADKSNLRTG